MSIRFTIWGLLSVIFSALGLVGLAFCIGYLEASLRTDTTPPPIVMISLLVSGIVFLVSMISMLLLIISLIVRLLRLLRLRAEGAANGAA